MEHPDMRYVRLRSLQQRPITLGELLLREEGLEMPEPTPTRSMARTMSPTRCLGPLASGRPRRARGRTLTRPSTSAELSDDSLTDPWPSHQRRRRASLGPLTIPTLARVRAATAEARIRNFHALLNGHRESHRGISVSARPRHHSLERSESPDLFFNPFAWQRRRADAAVGRQRRSRSVTDNGTRSRPSMQRRTQRIHSSFARGAPRVSHMLHVYSSREEYRAYRYLRAGRPHSGRSDPEPHRNTTDGNSEAEIPECVRRFIDFTAEFIPVEEPSPDAEPPEWSLNITAADFGPFAVGRSALSRARSLAVMGVLSQFNDGPTDNVSNSNDN